MRTLGQIRGWGKHRHGLSRPCGPLAATNSHCTEVGHATVRIAARLPIDA